MRSTIGQRIKEQRIICGFTQLQLAEKIFVTDKVLSKWENNRSEPSIDNLVSLSEVLKVDLNYLIKGDEFSIKSAKDLKIYLLDKNQGMTKMWKIYFEKDKNVEIINLFLNEFLDICDVDCVVSPANCFGIMDGGYDGAISDYFGYALSKCIQKKLLNESYGEQTVGTSIIVNIPHTNKKLIHSPAMREPSLIKDPIMVYSAMRSTLITALKNNITSIVIPAFGGSCGGLDYETIAFMMKKAFDQICEPPQEIDWNHVYSHNLKIG